MEYAEIKIRDNFWCFEQKGVRSFLLTGPAEALLIDSCYGGELRKLCEAKTDKPIKLILTHADRDHVGCVPQFDSIHLHPHEFAALESRYESIGNLQTLSENDILDIGSFRLEVLHLPGHTPGSIALLEREKRFLIGGDCVQTKPIHMFGPTRSLPAYAASMARLWKLRDLYDVCYASHGELALSPENVHDLYLFAEEASRGILPPALPLPADAPASVPRHIRLYRKGELAFYL